MFVQAMYRVQLKLQAPRTTYEIKAYRAGFQTIPIIFKQNELSRFTQPPNASVGITFSKLNVKGNSSCLSIFYRTQSAE